MYYSLLVFLRGAGEERDAGKSCSRRECCSSLRAEDEEKRRDEEEPFSVSSVISSSRRMTKTRTLTLTIPAPKHIVDKAFVGVVGISIPSFMALVVL